jgi:hypothetical protein
MARDTKALMDEVEYFDEPTLEMKRAAQRTICAYATDAAEAALFLDMCGVDPIQVPPASSVTSRLI